MSIGLYLVNKFSSLIPPTRFYKFKAFLYRCTGVNADESARIVSSVKIWGQGKIIIGSNTFIGHEVLLLSGAASIKIGQNVDIGPRVTIVNGTHEIDMLNEHTAGKGYSQDIFIDDGVWIGAGALIISGVSIGFKSMIAAGSVVTTNIPPYVIAAGVPCKPIKIWCDQTHCWKKVKVE